MPQHSDVSEKLDYEPAAGHRKRPPQLIMLVRAILAMLILLSLACSFSGIASPSRKERIVVRRLPPLTPTAKPTTIDPANSVAPAPAVEAQSSLPPDLSPIESDTALAVTLAQSYPSPTAAAVVSQQPAVDNSTDLIAPDQSVDEIAAVSPPVENSQPNPAAAPPPAEPPMVEPVAEAPNEAAPSTDTAGPVEVTVAAPTEEPLPTETPAPTPMPEGWVFTGVQITPKADGSGLLVHGNLLNNTSSAQKLSRVTGTFFDEQGQVIAGADDNLTDYWPIAAVPPTGQVPFELVASGLQNAADYDLQVEAEPGELLLRQDFEFIDVNLMPKEDKQCLIGKVRNSGSELQSYLVIAAVLYDAEGNVINYYDHLEQSIGNLKGDQTLDFEICVDPLNQSVARFEPQAWGL